MYKNTTQIYMRNTKMYNALVIFVRPLLAWVLWQVFTEPLRLQTNTRGETPPEVFWHKSINYRIEAAGKKIIVIYIINDKLPPYLLV